MSTAILRSIVLIGALVAGTGLAQADQPTDAKSDATPATPPAPSPEMLKKARDLGVKPEVRKGVTVFCWEDADIGSRFKTKKCVDENQLQALLEQRQAQRDAITRGGGNYGSTK